MDNNIDLKRVISLDENKLNPNCFICKQEMAIFEIEKNADNNDMIDSFRDTELLLLETDSIAQVYICLNCCKDFVRRKE